MKEGVLEGERRHKMKAPAERQSVEKAIRGLWICQGLQPMFAASRRIASCSTGPGVPALLTIPEGWSSWPHPHSSSPHLSSGTALLLPPTTHGNLGRQICRYNRSPNCEPNQKPCLFTRVTAGSTKACEPLFLPGCFPSLILCVYAAHPAIVRGPIW